MKASVLWLLMHNAEQLLIFSLSVVVKKKENYTDESSKNFK